MKYLSLLLGLLIPALSLASAKEAAWSEPVKGLCARLSVLPSEKEESPFCRIFIEFRNLDDVAGQKHIRFDPGKLELRVTDANGKELAKATGSYSAMVPLWEIIALPYAGTIKFQISFPGLGYNPATDKVIVDVGSPGIWVIPQNGSKYYLSGSLTIRQQLSDHPLMDWSGTLNFPKALIPSKQR